MYQIFGQVMHRVGKIADFGRKKWTWAADPHTVLFLGVPPSPEVPYRSKKKLIRQNDAIYFLIMCTTHATSVSG